MKLNSKAIKTVGVLAAAGALSLSSAVAGPYEMAPPPMDSSVPPPPAPMGDTGSGMFDNLGMTLSAGYDTDYIFRGFDLGHDFAWTALDLSVPLGEQMVFEAGAWYTTSFNTPGPGEIDSEIDLYASLTYEFGIVSVTAGYTHYNYPRGVAFGALPPEGGNGDETNEAFLSVGTSFADMVDVAVTYYHDFDLDVNYFEATAGTSFVVSPHVSIDPSVGISYVDVDNGGVSDWNHAFARVGVPIQLTETATLEPYVASSIALDAIDTTEKDYIWGGVSLSVSF